MFIIDADTGTNRNTYVQSLVKYLFSYRKTWGFKSSELAEKMYDSAK